MRRNKRGRRSFDDGGDINPMDGLSNLSDAMLILAVGIMLALILYWNVDWAGESSSVSEESNREGLDLENATEFSSDDLENVSSDETVSGDDMTQLGTVYYDEQTGTYYLIEDN